MHEIGTKEATNVHLVEMPAELYEIAVEHDDLVLHGTRDIVRTMLRCTDRNVEICAVIALCVAKIFLDMCDAGGTDAD